jgi:hypothetical protein
MENPGGLRNAEITSRTVSTVQVPGSKMKQANLQPEPGRMLEH